MPVAKRREYRRYPRIVDTTPRIAHSREDIRREVIRPTDKIKPKDWR